MATGPLMKGNSNSWGMRCRKEPMSTGKGDEALLGFSHMPTWQDALRRYSGQTRVLWLIHHYVVSSRHKRPLQEINSAHSCSLVHGPSEKRQVFASPLSLPPFLLFHCSCPQRLVPLPSPISIPTLSSVCMACLSLTRHVVLDSPRSRHQGPSPAM